MCITCRPCRVHRQPPAPEEPLWWWPRVGAQVSCLAAACACLDPHIACAPKLSCKPHPAACMSTWHTVYMACGAASSPMYSQGAGQWAQIPRSPSCGSASRGSPTELVLRRCEECSELGVRALVSWLGQEVPAARVTLVDSAAGRVEAAIPR